MIAVAAALLIAFLCLCLVFLVFFGQRQWPLERQVPQHYETLPAQIIDRSEELELISFQNNDYRLLSGLRELRPLRSKLWRDRRTIALLCLAELQTDAHVLWRFRRFLVRNGLQVTFEEESRILVAFLLLLSSLLMDRVAVFFCGPFFFRGVIRVTRAAVEQFSTRCDGLFSRLPREKRLELEQKWTEEVLATAPGCN